MKALYTLITVIMILPYAHAQIVQKGNLYDIELGDKTHVKVLSGFAEEGSHTYYYLPVNLRLSIRKDKTPEFSFLTYKPEDGNEISGAILHLLFEWGL